MIYPLTCLFFEAPALNFHSSVKSFKSKNPDISRGVFSVLIQNISSQSGLPDR
jgi:hypothetical protein